MLCILICHVKTDYRANRIDNYSSVQWKKYSAIFAVIHIPKAF